MYILQNENVHTAKQKSQMHWQGDLCCNVQQLLSRLTLWSTLVKPSFTLLNEMAEPVLN